MADQMWRSYIIGAETFKIEEPAEHPMEKAVQIETGDEHGLLLSDQGRVYSWGDNRFGQLGRKCVKKDEGDRAFVVSEGGLGEQEAVQIACGKHFCLVLCALGEVYAWGRNKAGQLGMQHTRDVTRPKLVKLPKNHPEKIVKIGCGKESGVAIGAEGSIWQWGASLQNFGDNVPNHTPFLVFSSARDGTLFTAGGSSSSKQKFSVDGVDARVPATVSNPSLFAEQLELARQCQITLGKLKQLLAESTSVANSKKKDREEMMMNNSSAGGENNDNKDSANSSPQKKKKQKAGVSELSTLSLVLDQEVQQCTSTITVKKQDLDEATEILIHLREQVHKLDAQTVTLADQLDQLQVQSLQTTGMEQKKLFEQMDRVREFQDSNSSSKLALLDQLQTVERKKQSAQKDLEMQLKKKDDLDVRAKTVQDFGKELLEGQGQAPILMAITSQLSKLRDALDERTELFSEKAPENHEEFVSQRENIEGLEVVESIARKQIVALEANSDTEEIARLLFLSLLTSLKEFLVLFKQRWLSQDVDITMFFD
ncbi:unnamed protein product [Amoebophrya sp. A120]|nr:unnamed protein product [Amoebophrya sp. A120]|eukprot:GSA120T00014898001.1